MPTTRSTPRTRLALVALCALTLAAGARQAPSSRTAASGTPARPAAHAPGLAFTDVTVELGLDFRHYDPLLVSSAEYAFLSGGATPGDVDGDGWVDVYATRYDASDLLFRNLGAGDTGHRGFADVTAASFTPLPGQGKSNGVLFFDMENDGDLDLYVTSLESTRYELWANDGAGRFVEEARVRGAAIDSPSPHTGMSVAAGDYDRDGWLDLFVAEWGNAFIVPGTLPSHARLLHNTGGGFFEDATDAAGVSIDHLVASGPAGTFTGAYCFSPTFADLDDDGWPDLAIASDFVTSRLFWNQGDGTFLDGTATAGVASDENGMGSTFGDFDADGDLDWFVSSIWDAEGLCLSGACNWAQSGNRLYRNEGGRSFSDATDEAGVRDGAWGWGSCFFDYDNDGDLDLAHTNGIDFPFTSIEEKYETDQTRFFVNDGEGRLRESATALGLTDTGSGKALFTFDYDRDGDLDVFIMQNALGPLVYRNEVGSRGNWLRVELRGSASNSFGIGARVSVVPRPGAPALVREAQCGANYLSQNEQALFFGLGNDADRVVEVRVQWPSGAVSTLVNVPRNRSITIHEDAGPQLQRSSTSTGAPTASSPSTAGVARTPK